MLLRLIKKQKFYLGVVLFGVILAFAMPFSPKKESIKDPVQPKTAMDSINLTIKNHVIKSVQ